MSTVVLIDLSSIAYPIFHMSGNEPDVNHVSTATVAKVRALASGQPHVAVCCDSGRSFRADLDPSYKATRGERDATLIHQLRLAQERLREDGFPVWSQTGMEADDLIATAACHATERGMEVLVISADKDLMQLVSPTVRQKSPQTGVEYDEAGVEAKLGVKPSQVRDYLSLVGDTADNVKGATGIGPKKASVMLWTHGDLEGIYAAAALEPSPLKPSEVASLAEFAPRMDVVRSLISLRYDADVPFEEVLRERVPVDAGTFATTEEEDPEVETEEKPQADGTVVLETVKTQAAPKVKADLLADVIAATPVEWERQLDPRSMREAQALAVDMKASQLFSGYGSHAGVLSTILAGRELGMPAMVALRSFHVIEGQARLSAEAIRARVITSGKAKFFRCIERTNERVTYETQRGDDPIRTLTFTIEDARLAYPKKDTKWEDSFMKSGWGRNPSDLLVARCSSKLAREVYPDVTLGLYAAEEFDQ